MYFLWGLQDVVLGAKLDLHYTHSEFTCPVVHLAYQYMSTVVSRFDCKK